MVLLVLCAIASTPAEPTLGLTDFATNSPSGELAAALTSVTGSELQRLGLFRVTTSETIRALLGLERQRQLMGCAESCSGGALSALTELDYLVTGRVNQVGGLRGSAITFTVELNLLDVKTSRRVSSELVTRLSEGELVTAVQGAVVKLVAPLLKGRSGSLVVSASEAGAAVKVDGTIVGTTPMVGRQTLVAGPHLVELEKDGFVREQREVRVKPDSVQEQNFQLVPSPDTIAAYEARTQRVRALAWGTSGLAVVGAGLFVGFLVRANALYGSPTKEGTFSWAKTQLDQGVEAFESTDYRLLATRLKGQVETAQVVAMVSLGVAAASVVAAVVLWIVGEDPSRYARYREVKVTLAPGAGGGLAFVF